MPPKKTMAAAPAQLGGPTPARSRNTGPDTRGGARQSPASNGVNREGIQPRKAAAAHDVEELEPDEKRNAAEDLPVPKAYFYPVLQWGLPPMGTAPTQGAEFLKWWEAITALACIWVGMVVPYTMAFAKVYIRSGEQCLFKIDPKNPPAPFFFWSRWIDIFVDGIFFVDICITFVTARWEYHSIPTAHWALVDDLPTIRMRYLKGLFVRDLIAWLPLQYLDCTPNVSAAWLKTVSLLRLLKLLRLKRLASMIQHLKEKYPRSVFGLTFLQLFLYFFLGAHWTACVFFSIGYGIADPEGSAWQEAMYLNGWVFQNGLLDESGFVIQYTNPWVTSLYWAVTTMSTIGYGDISPITPPERIVGMFLMSAGCAFFAWITGKITSLMTDKSPCEQRFEALMEVVDTFIDVHELPVTLRDKIKEYYKVKYPTKRIFDENDLIANIESPSLKRGIISHLFQDVVGRVDMFRLCDADVQMDICFKLKSIYRMANRQITEEGEDPDALYVIRFGRVAVTSEKVSLRTMETGELFGEMAMLGLTADGKRCRTTKTQSVSELCRLAKDDFEELLTNRPSFFAFVRNASRLHISRMKEAVTGPASADLDFRKLLYIEWPSIMDELEISTKSENMRKEATNMPQKTIDQAQAKAAGCFTPTSSSASIELDRLLCTKFAFTINRICGNIEFSADIHKALISISWSGCNLNTGVLPESVVQNDTATFKWKEAEGSSVESSIDVNRECHLPVLTRHRVPSGLRWRSVDAMDLEHNDKEDELVNKALASALERKTQLTQEEWDACGISQLRITHFIKAGERYFQPAKEPWADLPPFEIAVMTMATGPDPMLSNSKKTVSAHFAKGAEAAAATKRSLTYPRAKAAFVGQLSIKDAVDNRKAVNAKGVTIKLTSVTDKSKSVNLECVLRVFRRPLIPRWATVVDQVIAQGSSDFFERKLNRILDKVRTESEQFQDAIIENRLAMFKNFKGRNKTSANANKIAADVDVMGSDEKAVIEAMKGVLSTINGKLEGQDKFLKEHTDKIKDLRSTVAMIHLEVRKTVEGFMDESTET